VPNVLTTDNTKTLGLVYKPSFAPGWSLALDYFDIKVSNAITTVQGFNASYQQACYESGGTSPYCALQERPNGFADTSAANAIQAWYVTVINIASIKTAGLDAELSYMGRLFDRPLSVRGLVSYQPHIKFYQPATPTIDQGGVAFGSTGRTASPAWRVTGFLSYQLTDNFRFDVQQTWRSSMKLWATGEWMNNRVKALGTTSLNLNWKIPDTRLDNAEFFLNVQNLFNANPPVANAPGTTMGGFNGFVATDDPIGRYFTAGFRVKF